LNWEINKNHLELLGEVGRGSSGIVWKAEHKGKLVAAKEMIFAHDRLPMMLRDSKYQYCLREIHTLKRLKHINILKFKGVCLDGQTVYIITEFEESTLDNYLGSSKYTLPVALNIAKQIAEGLSFMHSKKRIHRDLNPKNILLTKDFKVKIGDFGLARDIKMPVLFDLTEGIGTILYMAPEFLERKEEPYNEKVDIFSFGVLLWTLIHPKQKLDGPPALARTPPPIKFDGDQRVSNLIVSCLKKNSVDRPDAKTLVVKLDFAGFK